MRERLVAALDRGERSRAALLAEVWDDVPEQLRPAAAMVMQAHLDKLEAEGGLPRESGAVKRAPKGNRSIADVVPRQRRSQCPQVSQHWAVGERSEVVVHPQRGQIADVVVEQKSARSPPMERGIARSRPRERVGQVVGVKGDAPRRSRSSSSGRASCRRSGRRGRQSRPVRRASIGRNTKVGDEGSSVCPSTMRQRSTGSGCLGSVNLRTSPSRQLPGEVLPVPPPAGPRACAQWCSRGTSISARGCLA